MKNLLCRLTQVCRSRRRSILVAAGLLLVLVFGTGVMLQVRGQVRTAQLERLHESLGRVSADEVAAKKDDDPEVERQREQLHARVEQLKKTLQDGRKDEAERWRALMQIAYLEKNEDVLCRENAAYDEQKRNYLQLLKDPAIPENKRQEISARLAKERWRHWERHNKMEIGQVFCLPPEQRLAFHDWQINRGEQRGYDFEEVTRERKDGSIQTAEAAGGEESGEVRSLRLQLYKELADRRKQRGLPPPKLKLFFSCGATEIRPVPLTGMQAEDSQ